jgi:hypothetical protein
MNIQVLLKHSQIGLRTGTVSLKNALTQSILVDIQTRTRLLEKKKEASKKRITTLANIQSNLVQEKRTDRLVDNIASGAGLLSLGVGGGRRSNITPRNNIVSTRGLRTKPGRFSGLSRFKNIRGISRGNVILNTAFAGLDFKNRKSLGQTNTQALAGAGGGAVGGIAGAAIGQALIPIPVIGALIGGFIGANLGSGVADRMSGVTSADFRRREEEKQTNLRENARTEFTEGLDRFDSALDKFGRYNEETDLFILKATGRDKDGKLIRMPGGGGGGVGQAFVNEAYRRGILVGASGLVLAIGGTVVAVKTGGVFIGLGKKLLLPMLARFGKTKVFQNILKFFKSDSTKKLKEQIIKKRLQEQAEKERLIEKILKNFKTKEFEESIKLGEEFSKRVDTLTGGLKKGAIRKEFSTKVGDKVKIKDFLDDLLDKEGITNIIKKSKNMKIDKNLQSNSNIDGGSGSTIAYNNEDSPYNGTINSIRAFNQMTV